MFKCKSCGREYVPKETYYGMGANPTKQSYCSIKCRSKAHAEMHFEQTCKSHGITVAQFNEMNATQAGRCAICKKIPGQGKRLRIDHNHKTGQVRGLLCDGCNTGLGLLGDSLENLQQGVVYLMQTLPHVASTEAEKGVV